MQTLVPSERAVVVSHNEFGQKLGRKGQATRERLIAAMLALLDEPKGPAITLALVATEAGVKPANLYRYFADIGQILLAALRRVMDTAEEAFIAQLRTRWPDCELEQRCAAFLQAHLAFWRQHARILHMRNAIADAEDASLQRYRSEAAGPLIELLAAQMDCRDEPHGKSCVHTATILLTALERSATVMTSRQLNPLSTPMGSREREKFVAELILAEARIIALAIADRRCAGARGDG